MLLLLHLLVVKRECVDVHNRRGLKCWSFNDLSTRVLFCVCDVDAAIEYNKLRKLKKA